MSNSGMVERRSILKTAATFGGPSTLAVIAPAVSEAAQESESRAAAAQMVRLEDVPAGPNAKITIERRGRIVLLGINRPNSIPSGRSAAVGSRHEGSIGDRRPDRERDCRLRPARHRDYIDVRSSGD